MSSSADLHHTTRPLDAVAIAFIVLLCLSWGLNQVAAKLAIHDIPPLMQGALRSVIAAVCVAAWCRLRRIPLFKRDRTLWPGVISGLVFGIEFVCIYQGIAYTTATRAVLFLYTTPFFVVIGAYFFLPTDTFKPWQWIGLCLSFGGILVAFGMPTPALDPRQTLGDILIIVGALGWAITTLIIKASRLHGTSPEKVMLYQLVISAPMLAVCAWIAGERMTHFPDALALGSLAYQSVWVVSVTYVVWFALMKKFSANRMSAFSFLTPLFGVAAGYLVLGDPLTPAFAAAVALVAAGLVLVNRTR